MNVRIRPATPEDLPAINDIYNHYVLHSTCTYQEIPSTLEERHAWFKAHDPQHPITVATDDHGALLGWGALSAFHSRCAYRFTVENSVYIHHAHHRQGLGRALLADLQQRAATLGHHSVLAVISADQAASVALHRSMGFTEAGLLRQVGYKFHRWLDVMYLQWAVPPARPLDVPHPGTA
jgi:L-amino acid N-acyltransferase